LAFHVYRSGELDAVNYTRMGAGCQVSGAGQGKSSPLSFTETRSLALLTSLLLPGASLFCYDFFNAAI
jgi:hypothetical protein